MYYNLCEHHVCQRFFFLKIELPIVDCIDCYFLAIFSFACRGLHRHACVAGTGTRRMELAQELARAEEDQTRLRAMVLKLQNERKEHEKWKRTQEEKLEELEEE